MLLRFDLPVSDRLSAIWPRRDARSGDNFIILTPPNTLSTYFVYRAVEVVIENSTEKTSTVKTAGTEDEMVSNPAKHTM